MASFIGLACNRDHLTLEWLHDGPMHAREGTAPLSSCRMAALGPPSTEAHARTHQTIAIPLSPFTTPYRILSFPSLACERPFSGFALSSLFLPISRPCLAPPHSPPPTLVATPTTTNTSNLSKLVPRYQQQRRDQLRHYYSLSSAPVEKKPLSIQASSVIRKSLRIPTNSHFGTPTGVKTVGTRQGGRRLSEGFIKRPQLCHAMDRSVHTTRFWIGPPSLPFLPFLPYRSLADCPSSNQLQALKSFSPSGQ